MHNNFSVVEIIYKLNQQNTGSISEIHKPEVSIIQIMGTLTDNNGCKANFRNIVLVMINK
ncbi:MAG: hypothetical protein ACTS7E_03340 [Arsenophonus sp. NC-CH8-MAG3]